MQSCPNSASVRKRIYSAQYDIQLNTKFFVMKIDFLKNIGRICLLIFMMTELTACESENNTAEYIPDFIFENDHANSNVILFTNTTQGDHLFWRWDFGNGQKTDREKIEDNTYSVFYPEKGTYEVELRVWGIDNELSNNKSKTKTIQIEQDIFVADFSYSIDNSNYVELTNTTIGDYDRISWKYEQKEIELDDNGQTEMYFAFAGTYEIELHVFKGDYEKIVNKKLIIENDDTDYLSNYKLVWFDEFDGEVLDPSKWTHETGSHGWGNSELQNYTDGDNTSISEGILKIKTELIGAGQKTGDYTSSRINSKQRFTYGRYEIRAKMPDYKGSGLWPAIWMLGESIQQGTSWPLCGEIDIMEYVSWDPHKVSAAIHTESKNHTNGNNISSGHIDLLTAESEFHTYGLIWSEKFLKFYLDDPDHLILKFNRPDAYTQKEWPFDKPFYFLMNIAVGGNYGGVNGVEDHIFPSEMEVDYIRVYQFK